MKRTTFPFAPFMPVSITGIGITPCDVMSGVALLN